MKVTSVIVDEIYPIVEKAMDKNKAKYTRYLNKFFNDRSKDIYDIVPQNRIFFGAEDTKAYFTAIGIDPKDIENILKKAYFWNMNFNPRCIKVPLVPTQMMVIRYFLKKKDRKNAEISGIYLAFSGNFYPSIHSQKFIYPPKRHVLEYVVNNELTQKFDLKREGSIFGAIRSIVKTWLNTYEDKLIGSADDEDIADIVQQLHGRIKSFLGNIVAVWKKVYQDPNLYMSYESDSESEEDYRIADSDSLKAERAVENAMTYVTSQSVDYKLCKLASDSNVRIDEVRSIIEGIQDDPDNIPIIKELISITISDYMTESTDKDVTSVSFITKSIAPKPNTKNKKILRQKEILENWLNETSSQYRKRKSRAATKSSYNKALLKYYVLLINKANK